MPAFVSLHTAPPTFQCDHEVSYKGYCRMPVDYCEGFGNKPVEVIFPQVSLAGSAPVTHVCIGSAELGNGEVFLTIANLPHIPIVQGEQPRVIFINVYPYPENINPIARTAHALAWTGEMKAEDLHPALYEAINDALHNVGVPVMKVTRMGIGDLKHTGASLG